MRSPVHAGVQSLQRKQLEGFLDYGIYKCTHTHTRTIAWGESFSKNLCMAVFEV